MKDLLVRLHSLNLSTEQIEEILFVIDHWLEDTYPVMSQMFKQQLLSELLIENRQTLNSNKKPH